MKIIPSGTTIKKPQILRFFDLKKTRMQKKTFIEIK
jgi:hypothetical protein